MKEVGRINVPGQGSFVVTFEPEGIMGRKIETLELSGRALNALRQRGVDTLGDLVELTEHDLLYTKNFGKTSLHEVKRTLDEEGLHLATKSKTDLKRSRRR